jgi:glycosyltransferase involved in cell wall biosynthesis
MTETGLSLPASGSLKFSVIIPDTNSLLMGEVIQALSSQTVDLSEGEVLVVGCDRPGLVVESERLKFIDTSGVADCASDKRNLGMQMAHGSIFLFLDDDCVPSPDWIERHLSQHARGEMVVGGAVVFKTYNYCQVADNVSAFHDLLPWMPAGLRPYLAAANLSIDRSVVEHAGMMEPHQNRADDLEWTVRLRSLGYRLHFEPQAVVSHDPQRRDFASVWRHWSRDAENTLRVRLKYAGLLNTPSLAQYRASYLWGAPFVAAWATWRTFSNGRTLRLYGYTLPLVYITKLAWCWGALLSFRSRQAVRMNRNRSCGISV